MADALLNERLALAEHSAALRDFCERWRVVELAVFGSVLRDDFTDASDVDVLLLPEADVIYRIGDLLTMQDELEHIFGRKVDVGTRRAVERDPNYLRRRAILGSAQVIYAKR